MEYAVMLLLSLCVFLLLFIYMFIPPSSTVGGIPVWYTPKRLISYRLDGRGTSLQAFDIYSFSHITHGILFYFILKKLGMGDNHIVYISACIEFLWEYFENTPFIINKYRRKKEFKNFKGDSIANILGDIIATTVGIYLSYLSPVGAVIYAVVSEMFLYPVGANFLYLSLGSLLR